MKFNIKLLYLYLFSFIGLLVVVIGSIRLVDLGLKVYVFKGADEYTITYPMVEPSKIASDEAKIQVESVKNQKLETVRNRHREFSGAIALVLVGLPLYLYHWKKIQDQKNA
jgi:hypothetical protein